MATRPAFLGVPFRACHHRPKAPRAELLPLPKGIARGRHWRSFLTTCETAATSVAQFPRKTLTLLGLCMSGGFSPSHRRSSASPYERSAHGKQFVCQGRIAALGRLAGLVNDRSLPQMYGAHGPATTDGQRWPYAPQPVPIGATSGRIKGGRSTKKHRNFKSHLTWNRIRLRNTPALDMSKANSAIACCSTAKEPLHLGERQSVCPLKSDGHELPSPEGRRLNHESRIAGPRRRKTTSRLRPHRPTLSRTRTQSARHRPVTAARQ